MSCEHFKAEATGTTEARWQRGKWLYRTPYFCPDCGERFVEHHASDSLSTRIDLAFVRLARLSEGLKPGA